MKAVYTDPVRTVFEFAEAEAAMRWALAGQLGTKERHVPDEVVALAMAKTALEIGRYKSAWAAPLQGDAREDVHRLKVAGYFTADEAAYMRGVESLFREMLSRIRKLPDVPEANVDWTLLRAQLPILQVDWESISRERRANLAG